MDDPMIKLRTWQDELLYLNPAYVSLIKQNTLKGFEHLVLVHVVGSSEPVILEGDVKMVKRLVIGGFE